jgi:YesN/AraC family two-component response regulator
MEAKIRVLIADDRPRSRNGLRAVVATWPNIEVVGEAGNGQEAVRLAEAGQADAVLMDVCMPVMDGLTATRLIKEHQPQIKVVILTMYPMYRKEALSAGADAFLVKGCSTEDLLAALGGPATTEQKRRVSDEHPE